MLRSSFVMGPDGWQPWRKLACSLGLKHAKAAFGERRLLADMRLRRLKPGPDTGAVAMLEAFGIWHALLVPDDFASRSPLNFVSEHLLAR